MDGFFHHLRMPIKVLEKKRFHGLNLLCHRFTKRHHGASPSGLIGTLWRMQFQMRTRGVNHVIDLITEHAANGFIQEAPGF